MREGGEVRAGQAGRGWERLRRASGKKEMKEKKGGEEKKRKWGKGEKEKGKGGGRCAPAATAAVVGHAWRAGRGRWGTRSGEKEKGAGFTAAGHDASRWMGKRWDVD